MNYMEQVAKMLGVELGERFKIDFGIYNNKSHNFDYYISDQGIIIDQDGYACCSNDILCEIIRGNYTIKSKPWKPKQDESYWYVNMFGTGVRASWGNCLTDRMLYKLGNCYRTSEEAEANRDKWTAFYASNEVLEV